MPERSIKEKKRVVANVDGRIQGKDNRQGCAFLSSPNARRKRRPCRGRIRKKEKANSERLKIGAGTAAKIRMTED